VDVKAEEIRRHYESLSDEALLDIDPAELVAAARTCHADEMSRRGLISESSEGEDNSPAPDSAAATATEELVCVVEYDYLDEADLARGLLEAAEIPASLESEPGVVRLMVPAGLAEQALSMLAAPLSDEELEAHAEAAGQHDQDPEGDARPEA
jgi:hypothetical protein